MKSNANLLPLLMKQPQTQPQQQQTTTTRRALYLGEINKDGSTGTTRTPSLLKLNRNHRSILRHWLCSIGTSERELLNVSWLHAVPKHLRSYPYHLRQLFLAINHYHLRLRCQLLRFLLQDRFPSSRNTLPRCSTWHLFQNLTASRSFQS